MRVAPSQCELFNISTSKSGPRISVFCTLWLRSVLCATTACPFVNNWTSKSAPTLTLVCFYHFDVLACFARTLSTSQFPKVLRTRSGFNVVTSKCALRHSAVQFLISHLPRWLCTRRFREPTFRPSGILQHWKNTAFRDFSTFSCALIFFVLTFSLLCLLSSSLPTSAAAFAHIVGNLTKHPSVIELAIIGSCTFKYAKTWRLAGCRCGDPPCGHGIPPLVAGMELDVAWNNAEQVDVLRPQQTSSRKWDFLWYFSTFSYISCNCENLDLPRIVLQKQLLQEVFSERCDVEGAAILLGWQEMIPIYPHWDVDDGNMIMISEYPKGLTPVTQGEELFVPGDANLHRFRPKAVGGPALVCRNCCFWLLDATRYCTDRFKKWHSKGKSQGNMVYKWSHPHCMIL